MDDALTSIAKFSEALSYYEKGLKIAHKILPPSHSDLATSYNNIVYVYSKIGKHTKALSSYQYAVDIGQHSLPANHSDRYLYKMNLERCDKKL